MSQQVYTDLGTKYTIFAGTTKGFQSQIIDPGTGTNIDMTNLTLYASGYVDITDANGVVIVSNVSITFPNRTAGTSYVQWVVGPFLNSQAGNWQGFLKVLNSTGQVIDQQKFNFVIEESF